MKHRKPSLPLPQAGNKNSPFELSVLSIFGIITAVIAVFALFLYPPIAKLPQKITDFYYDYLWTNTNKSGELYFLAFLTVFGISLAAWLDKKRNAISEPSASNSLYLALVLLPLLAAYCIHGWIPQFILNLTVIFLATYLVRRHYILKTLLAYFLIYYACLGLVSLFDKNRITETIVTLISCVIFLPVFWVTVARDNEIILDRIILASQIIIPLCLFVFLKNKHLVGDEIVIIPFRRRYSYIITAAITGSTGYALFRFLRSFRTLKTGEQRQVYTINKLILLTTLCVISAFRVDINISRIVPPGSYNFWHYGERVLPWQQIVEFGKIPYKEFFPPSGLFPLVNGFFLNTFFDGTASSIYPALTLEQVFYGALIALGLAWAAGSAFALSALLLLPINSYERFHLIYFSLALLAVPCIWKDINRWLKVWVLLVIANMLNYPLFGMSLTIGGLPFACTGIYLAIKKKHFVSWLRKPSFYAAWLALFVVIIPFVPLVLRMVSTSAISGGATAQADGRALLTNDLTLPGYLPVRILQYTVILTGLALAIILPAYILIRTLKAPIPAEEKLESPMFYFSTLCLFFLPAAYSFGVIRLDNGAFARASGPIAICAVLCIIALVKHAKTIFSGKERISLIIVLLCLAVPSHWNYGRLSSFKNINKISVPVETVRISDENREKMPRLGTGFIHQEDINRLNFYYSFLDSNSLLGYNFYSGAYLNSFILNMNVPATDAFLSRGYELEKLYYNIFKSSPIVIAPGSMGNPYIKYWLAIDDGLVQTPEGFWVTQELVKNKYSPEELIKPVFHTGMGLHSVAYGRSMKSLRPIFDRVSEFEGSTGESYAVGLKGTAADYVYIELETEAKIENHYFKAWDFSKYGIEFHYKHNGQWDFWYVDYGDGRLLLPAGDDSRWLYDNIEEIKVVLAKGFMPESQGKIKKIELLKLRRYR